MSNGSGELVDALRCVTDGGGSVLEDEEQLPHLQRTREAVEHIQSKIQKTKDLIREEQKARDGEHGTSTVFLVCGVVELMGSVLHLPPKRYSCTLKSFWELSLLQTPNFPSASDVKLKAISCVVHTPVCDVLSPLSDISI